MRINELLGNWKKMYQIHRNHTNELIFTFFHINIKL